MATNYKHFLDDFVDIKLDQMVALKKAFTLAELSDKEFINGQIVECYENLTLLNSQAELFGIELIKMRGVDLEAFLLR